MPEALCRLPGLNRKCQEALKHWAVTVNSDWQHVISPLSASASSAPFSTPPPPLHTNTHQSSVCTYCTYQTHTDEQSLPRFSCEAFEKFWWVTHWLRQILSYSPSRSPSLSPAPLLAHTRPCGPPHIKACAHTSARSGMHICTDECVHTLTK